MVEIAIELGRLRQVDSGTVRAYFYDRPNVAAGLEGIGR